MPLYLQYMRWTEQCYEPSGTKRLLIRWTLNFSAVFYLGSTAAGRQAEFFSCRLWASFTGSGLPLCWAAQVSCSPSRYFYYLDIPGPLYLPWVVEIGTVQFTNLNEFISHCDTFLLILQTTGHSQEGKKKKLEISKVKQKDSHQLYHHLFGWGKAVSSR